MQVVVLEVETNSWKIDHGLDANLLQFLGVTNTRSLKDKRTTQSTTADDNELSGLECTSFDVLSTRDRGCRDGDNASGNTIFNDDSIDLSVALKV